MKYSYSIVMIRLIVRCTHWYSNLSNNQQY